MASRHVQRTQWIVRYCFRAVNRQLRNCHSKEYSPIETNLLKSSWSYLLILTLPPYSEKRLSHALLFTCAVHPHNSLRLLQILSSKPLSSSNVNSCTQASTSASTSHTATSTHTIPLFHLSHTLHAPTPSPQPYSLPKRQLQSHPRNSLKQKSKLTLLRQKQSISLLNRHPVPRVLVVRREPSRMRALAHFAVDDFFQRVDALRGVGWVGDVHEMHTVRGWVCG